MQNVPLNQLSPELIQAYLTQGMFQPIEQANPYVNMIDPNMNQLAYAPQKPKSGYIYSYGEGGFDQFKNRYNERAYAAGANRVSDKNSPFYGMTMEEIQQKYPRLINQTEALWKANEGL